MKEYTVAWAIELDANSPREAAELALEIMQDPTSEAVCFLVDGEVVNLLEEV